MGPRPLGLESLLPGTHWGERSILTGLNNFSGSPDDSPIYQQEPEEPVRSGSPPVLPLGQDLPRSSLGASPEAATFERETVVPLTLL